MLLTDSDKRMLLTFFAAMLWQDGSLHADEQAALQLAGRELGLDADDPQLGWLGELPPAPEEVDPQAVPDALRVPLYGFTALAAGVRPSLAKFEALELLQVLLRPGGREGRSLGLAA